MKPPKKLKNIWRNWELEIPEGYKKTKLGVIPLDWDVIPIQKLGKVKTGKTPSTSNSEYFDGGIPFITPADMSDSKYIENVERSLTEIGLKETVEIPAGSILVTCIGSTIGKMGMTKVKSSTNQQVNTLIPSSNYSGDYLFYAMKYLLPKLLPKYETTTAVPIVNKSSFEKIPIIIMGKVEQEKIASILSSVDQAIFSTKKVIEKTERLKKGLMQKLLTQGIGHTEFKETKLGYIPKCWQVVKLQDILEEPLKNGASGPVSSDGTGTRMYTLSAVTNDDFSFKNTKLFDFDVSDDSDFYVRKGDIFVSRSNTRSLVGKVAMVMEDQKIVFPDLMIRIRINSNKVSTNFALIFLQSIATHNWLSRRAQGTSSSMKKISQGIVEQIPFPIPSKVEQDAIVDNISCLNTKMKNVKSEYLILSKLKQSLMQKLLTGKMRVTGVGKIE